ncbi:glycosyltransferase family 2 protein [Flavobacterium sp.]|uniref:glycosyltransferase family 2 protein n=1 Tax=Flavobacterium sp. TaxID=239 RepID=UPI00286B30DB|nr:glycosyltransferase family 2 protein [Flavobacterium sp.]
MQLSIIILNYNVRYFLELCVLSVQKAIQNIDAEIIVVDNNSPDDSFAMMKSRFPNVKLIENKENSGFPKGNNIGVAQAEGKYICILNPDTVVAEDTFIKILDFAQKQKNLGIVGCKLIDGTGNFLPESKRGVPTPFVAFTKIFGLYKVSNYFGKYYAQHLNENETGKVDILVGAFMVMKRELYLEVGGFDENCFMYSDDIDLSYMVSLKGKSNYYFHETTVIHYKGESTVKDNTYMKRFQEAMNFFYKKHFHQSLLFDVFMRFGSFVFSNSKKNKQINKKFLVDEYIFFSKSNSVLSCKKNVFYCNDFKKFTNRKHTNYEIIFDINSFSFNEIISFMEAKKSKNIRFKNYIANSKYIIGSNSSNDRGEVILVSDLK